jgi:hypothetical protein
MFRFKCATCDEWHEGVPGFGYDAPLYYHSIPEDQRAVRCDLDEDTCIVDDEHFFVRGCIEITVDGQDEPFIWGVWVSLSRPNFEEYLEHFSSPDRSRLGPYFGWLSAALPVYPDTENLKTMVCPRQQGLRPQILLEPTDHPLAVEQRNGMSMERVIEICSKCQH